jgi:catechol 2,3-dioxygenase-like lactoylglutathione lyase family enzyme
MRLIRHVVVFDAADIGTESRFWADMLDGRVIDDDPRFHCVIDRDDNWVIGVQHAPDHSPPDWPDGAPQQLHLDLHVDDARVAIAQATRLGARPLLTDDDVADDHGHHVFADPAGHPFCIGWGHPTHTRLHEYIRTLPPPATP